MKVSQTKIVVVDRRLFQLYRLVEFLNRQIHFIFLEKAQAEIVVHARFVSVQIDSNFQLVYTWVEIAQFAVVYPKVVSTEV